MPDYVCKLCGEPVSAEFGREIRAAVAHAQKAGHANAGLTHPNSIHARTTRWTGPRRATAPRPGQPQGSFPSQRRVVFGLVLLGLAFVAGVTIAEAVDDDPPAFLGCHERVIRC
ncbi:hypothetical protein [Streptomyces achromogenes]|uniref:hypothetical protein n=1 Tax=Streptomyces achromogenes TaxID=67255 RepID=UPI0012FF4586|nr:hypothetical protein [Streptomyces achromogenes]